MCKNLFMKDKKKTVRLLIVALSDTIVNTKHLQSVFKVKNLRLAAEETLKELLAVGKGAVTPLALFADKDHDDCEGTGGHRITLILDKKMIETKGRVLCFHPLRGNDRTVVLDAQSLLKYIQQFCGHSPNVMSLNSED